MGNYPEAVSRLRVALLALLVIVLVAVVGGYWYARPLLLTGTGYAAHNACALHQVAGREDPGDDLPPNPLVPLLTSDVDQDGATSSVLGVLSKQRAWATDGYGCTLADERPELAEPTAVTASDNPYADPGEPTPSPAVEAALDTAFGQDLSSQEQQDLGTRAVVVLKDGELVAERYAEGFDRETPQLGWSMAKSVTNLLTGRLVKQDVIDLEDDHLRPEWDDERGQITVENLLRMTSGLAWDETYALGTPITRMLYLEGDMGSYVASQELAHEPGDHFQYSSGSTTLLCSILTDRSGVGADLPRQEVFAPLGLSSAVLEPDASGTPVCSSYMWATPLDWAAVGQFALQDGVWDGDRLLPRGWIKESTTPTSVDADGQAYASGWWVNSRPDGSLVHSELPEDAYFAQGHDGQSITVVPSQDLVVVRLGFTPSREDNRSVQLAADLVAGLE